MLIKQGCILADCWYVFYIRMCMHMHFLLFCALGKDRSHLPLSAVNVTAHLESPHEQTMSKHFYESPVPSSSALKQKEAFTKCPSFGL